MRIARWWSAGLLVALLPSARAFAQEEGPSAGTATPAVFRRFSEQVVKIQIVERSSAAKAVAGSGFYVTPRGHLVTNYHVVAKIIHDPDRYRGDAIDHAGTARPIRILAVDVVHDVAVLQVDHRPARHFALGPVSVVQGQRLYSLGHPRELGIAIVEGTYNGRLRHTLFERIHFTGALNPGMSGGPTITGDGRVAGVNVASAGNEVGFLVPVERASALLARVLRPGYQVPDSFLVDVGRQLREYQDTYVGTLFADSVPTVTLGSYRLPTQPARFFNCWADADRSPEQPYDVVEHECTTDDYVYISPDQSSGFIHFDHRLLESDELNRFRFAALYTDQYHSMGWWWLSGGEDEVTPFRCQTRNVRSGTLTFKTVLCLRRYKKFAGLYDAVLRAAVLGRPGEGLLTSLVLSGVSYENAMAVTRRYLEGITWTR